MKLRAVLESVKQGESLTLEFKRSTGELREGMQTLCALLNGDGGLLLFGIRPDGSIDYARQRKPATNELLKSIKDEFSKNNPLVD